MPNKEQILGITEPEVKFSIEEASGDVNGQSVLAKVKGTFFVPDGSSRNKRWYPKELWEKQLGREVIQKKLEDRRMFGTISHEQKLDDKAVLEGKISHIVSALQIKGSQGYGEALVLNTPAGTILNTLLRAGCKLFVSSRANGAYQGTHEGMPVVDPDQYELETFDFVLEPGFLQANPRLAESLLIDILGSEENITPESPISEENIGESIMAADNTAKTGNASTELYEKLLNENLSIKADFQKTVDQVADLQGKNAIVTEKHSVSEAALKESSDQLKKVTEQLKAYEDADVGTPAEIVSALGEAEKQLDGYRKFGTLEELSKKISAQEEAIAKHVANEKAYLEFGTIEELGKAFESMDQAAIGIRDRRNLKRVREMAKELNVPATAIAKLYGRVSEKTIRESFASVRESSTVASRFQKPVTEAVTADAQAKLDEKKNSIFNKDRGASLMEHFSK